MKVVLLAWPPYAYVLQTLNGDGPGCTCVVGRFSCLLNCLKARPVGIYFVITSKRRRWNSGFIRDINQWRMYYCRKPNWIIFHENT